MRSILSLVDRQVPLSFATGGSRRLRQSRGNLALPHGRRCSTALAVAAEQQIALRGLSLISTVLLFVGWISPGTALTDLGMDSLASLEFAFVLEDTFHVTLDAETDLRGETVQHGVDVVNLALSRQPATASAAV